MKTIKILFEALFYLFVLAVLLSRAVTQVVSHDENQFIAAGQMLADHGWLPYRDYPYTHMPYAVAFYAFSARVSAYAYLSARILGALTWLGCIALLIAISRLLGWSFFKLAGSDPPWSVLLGEFVLVGIFLYYPDSVYVLGAALNHSFATFFSLLAFFFLALGITQHASARVAAFWSAACISMAACIRLNYASLVVILLGIWLAYLCGGARARLVQCMIAFCAGLLGAALPALALLALAPAHFYYGNLLYIQLNTLYYRGILFRQTMDLPSKVQSFLNDLVHSPIDIALYSIVLVVGLAFLVRFIRRRSPLDLLGLAAASFAGALFASCFSPTPTQAHYFFAPIPFMLIIVSLLGMTIYAQASLVQPFYALSLLALLAITARNTDPLGALAALTRPSAWPPVQVHEFAEGLISEQRLPPGRVLSLLPMLTDEAGFVPYPFTATGPFSWRTSLLLTSQRRALYGVTSPQELPAALNAAQPVAILTGFEAPNAGFTFGDLGGLETPFVEYAQAHGYRSIPLHPAFVGRTIYLWTKP